MKLSLPEYSIYLNNNELNNLGKHIKSFYYGKRLFIITDENVYKLYQTKVNELLSDFLIEWVVITPGEQSKSMQCYLKVIDQLLNLKINRKHFVVALGGGVVGDLAGFVCATLLRGLPYIQVPTTLLAMVDSSIGSKVGINTEVGKNILGAFYAPKRVVIDPLFLETLPQIEYINGMAETIKAGLIGNKKLYNHFLDRDKVDEQQIIEAIKVKRKLVLIDPKEQYERMLLNFGHTFGHAIEKRFNYAILHGQAVAHGMIMELQIGVKNGWSINIVDELTKILKRIGLITQDLNYQDYLGDIVNDKKIFDDGLSFICIENISKAYVRKLDINKL